jgi:hypothetical protein
MQRIFSGIAPSGIPTLGNYLGALRNWVALQDGHECIYCVVDCHAITVFQDPLALRTQTREMAASLLACGIDARKHIVFLQSMVPAHVRLAWIFNCVARVGWLNRMTQFKDKAGKDRENASSGLYVYPNLMAADILAYHATRVPVGDDQRQHLELANDIAQKFNHDYGVDFFPAIEPVILGVAARVMSLRDGSKKMSKSDPSEQSRINLTDDADAENPAGEDRPGTAAERAGGAAWAAGSGQSCRHFRRARRHRSGQCAARARRQRLWRVQGGVGRTAGGAARADRRRDAAAAGRSRRGGCGAARRRQPRGGAGRPDRDRGGTAGGLFEAVKGSGPAPPRRRALLAINAGSR